MAATSVSVLSNDSVNCAMLFLAGTSPLQVELGANLFVYISIVTCRYLSLLMSLAF